MNTTEHPDTAKLQRQSQMLEKTKAIQCHMAKLAEADEDCLNQLRDVLNGAAILSVTGAEAGHLCYLVHCYLILYNYTKKVIDLDRAREIAALLDRFNFLVAGKTYARLGAVSRQLNDLYLAIRLAELIKSSSVREEIYAEVARAVLLDPNHTARVAIAYNLAPEIRDSDQRKNFLASFSRLSRVTPQR